MGVPTSEVRYTIATTRREKTTKFIRTGGDIGGKTVDYIVQAIYDNTFHTSQQTFRKTVCDTEVIPTYYTLKTIYSVPRWSQFDSLENRYIYNDSNTLVEKIIHMERIM
jgi:hypothetical protein